MASVQRTIMLPESVSDRLTQRAEVEDRPVSRIVSQAVRAYLDEREGQQ
jgi:predicted transcriptional regulator